MTAPASATIQVARDFRHAPERLFAHWVSPETRRRWEAPPDSGMEYLHFDPREGGEEIIAVRHGGGLIGFMRQRHVLLQPGSLIVTATEGVFGGRVSLLMQIVVRFLPVADGGRIEAVAQVTDLAGDDPADMHRSGWNTLFDNFTKDIAEHGLVET